MIPKQADDIHKAIVGSVNGNYTLDEILGHILTGAIASMNTFRMYARSNQGEKKLTDKEKHDICTDGDVELSIVEALLDKLAPTDKEMPAMTKWYVIKYEEYCEAINRILKTSLDLIRDNHLYGEIFNEMFANNFDLVMKIEKEINERLGRDGFHDEVKKKYVEWDEVKGIGNYVKASVQQPHPGMDIIFRQDNIKAIRKVVKGEKLPDESYWMYLPTL